MALRNLSSPVMVSISTDWLDPERMRPILERYRLTGALLPFLAEVHENLIQRNRAISLTQSVLADLQRELAELDAHHDRKIRGIFGTLTAFAELADDAEKARAYLDLRGRLLPNGLRAVSRSYMDQSGEVLLLEARLDAASIETLREIPSPAGTLLDEVKAWIRLGREIGDLDMKRTSLTRHRLPGDTTQADVARARNEWIRLAHMLRSSLSLDGAEPEVIEKVFALVDHEEAKADRRQASVKEPSPPPSPPPPCSDSPPPPDEGPGKAP